jgi:ATP-dependent protease ClpP protease subunit
MSDAYVPSPAEQEANAIKLAAEAEKALAEAEKARAEAVTFGYEARAALARTIETELKSAQAVEADAARRASDEYHRVYRFDGEVSASSVHACMSKLTEWHRLDPKCTIEVIFSSPGGSIFDGMELFDFITELGERGHKTVTGGVGMAASMAGILVQAGQTRYLTKECWLLIHRASFLTFGSTYEVEDMVQLIKRIEKRITDIFVSRSGGKLTAQRVKRNWNRKDWWISSDECLELGLVDEVRGQIK